MANRRKKENILYHERMGDHDIPFYRLETTDGLIAEVPKYIRRIVSRRQGKINAKGWQIAYVRLDVEPFNPFFPDSNSDPFISLNKAVNELRRFLSRTPNTRQSGLQLEERKRELYRTGIPGIRLDWRFGRRNALYDLKVEVRSGAYNPDRAKSFYVGTEFSVTRERLETVLAKAKQFRDQHVLLASENGQTFLKPIEEPAITMTADRALEILQKEKESRIDRLDQIAVEKAARWLSEKRLSMTFRNNRFKAKEAVVKGHRVKIPDFIWLEGDEWQFEFELPNGTLHQDFLPLSAHPKEDLERAMADCFLESMLVSVPFNQSS